MPDALTESSEPQSGQAVGSHNGEPAPDSSDTIPALPLEPAPNDSEPLPNEQGESEAPSEPALPLEPAYPAPILQFVEHYKEFAGADRDLLVRIMVKVQCLYPQYKNAFNKGADCDLKYPLFMLMAHYLTIGGYAEGIGLGKQSGLVASSSIDSVSVSYQQAPVGNNFQYFFSQTPYGQEYLAYINTRSGLMLVN